VINISSISARFGRPGFSPYCSSKWALEGLSESLYYELESHGVHVILIEPGSFKSDIHTRNRLVARGATLETSPHRAALQRMERALDQFLGSAEGPAAVARTIVRAALTPRPQLRYVVGWDARKKALSRALLPSRVFSRTVRRWG
jgi:NAD(P)-dependent dehydrogenase (short-subunit alcohol dehydrogenase family)